MYKTSYPVFRAAKIGKPHCIVSCVLKGEGEGWKV